ncbi:MAG: hypothetical protein IKI30_05855 [Oxalobacter sp.]|nr:hypothetical protein [Oxalobacter sp.]
MATSREDRKRELLAEGIRLREMLAFQIQSAVQGPNAITRSVKIVKKIKSLGIKPFAIGGGGLALLLLKPWRFFSKKKQQPEVPVPKSEGLVSKLIRYAKVAMPVARIIMNLGQTGNASPPPSQFLAFLLQKLSSLFPKKNR